MEFIYIYIYTILNEYMYTILNVFSLQSHSNYQFGLLVLQITLN